MKSRVHPTYKKKYRIQNWASYDRSLVRRGDITIWLSPAAIAAWEPARAGTAGRAAEVLGRRDRIRT